MFIVFVVLTVIISVLMILIVLIQKSKGGGLSSQFGGGNQVLGVRGTNSFLEKATWTLAILILALSVGAARTMPKAASDQTRADAKDVAAPATNNQTGKFDAGAKEVTAEPTTATIDLQDAADAGAEAVAAEAVETTTAQ